MDSILAGQVNSNSIDNFFPLHTPKGRRCLLKSLAWTTKHGEILTNTLLFSVSFY